MALVVALDVVTDEDEELEVVVALVELLNVEILMEVELLDFDLLEVDVGTAAELDVNVATDVDPVVSGPEQTGP